MPRKSQAAAAAQDKHASSEVAFHGEGAPIVQAEQAVAIATDAPEVENPVDFVGLKSKALFDVVASADSLADSDKALKAAYGTITANAEQLLTGLSLETAVQVIEHYLNNHQLTGLGKHTLNSRRKVIAKAFSKSFEGYSINWEYSQRRSRYDAWSDMAPDAEVKATNQLAKAVEACAKVKMSKAEIIELIEAAFGE